MPCLKFINAVFTDFEDLDEFPQSQIKVQPFPPFQSR